MTFGWQYLQWQWDTYFSITTYIIYNGLVDIWNIFWDWSLLENCLYNFMMSVCVCSGFFMFTIGAFIVMSFLVVGGSWEWTGTKVTKRWCVSLCRALFLLKYDCRFNCLLYCLDKRTIQNGEWGSFMFISINRKLNVGLVQFILLVGKFKIGMAQCMSHWPFQVVVWETYCITIIFSKLLMMWWDHPLSAYCSVMVLLD